MDQEIKITAEVDKVNPAVCKFTVDRPVHPRRISVDRGSSKGVALTDKLFEIEEIMQVTLFGPIVVLAKSEGRDWREIGRASGARIREFLNAGLGPTEEQMKAALPDPGPVRKKIQELFETQINPNVASHGGYVELIDFLDNNVYLRMGGGCQGCGMADVTLKQGIETLIREEVPEVWQVLDVTDHAGGRNPYYEPAK